MILEKPHEFVVDLNKSKRIRTIKTINYFDDVLLRVTADLTNEITVEIKPK